ncbi:MAG: tetratricopeptide repeat protein [Polyangiaceae bacterium]
MDLFARPAIYAALMALLSVGRPARAEDAQSAARTQLRLGYDLKKQGKCEQALPYFEESARLDRKPKALLNLGDCEAQLGRLWKARGHASEARDLARAQGDPLLQVAEQRVAEFEGRLPKLTLRLAESAAGPDTHVTRDGLELAATSLGVAEPVEPGTHHVVVRGAQYEQAYDVELAEGEARELVVTWQGGQALVATPPPAAAKPVVTAPVAPAPAPRNHSRQITGGALAGAGVVAAVFGVAFGLRTASKNREIRDVCGSGANCPDDAAYSKYLDLRQQASSSRTVSLVSFGLSVPLIAAGVYFLVPRKAEPTATSQLRLTPTFGASGFACEFGGRF